MEPLDQNIYLDINPNTNNDINFERRIWMQYNIKKWIFIPIVCILCGKAGPSITEN